MKRISLTLLLLLALWLPGHIKAQGTPKPSFDCTKAQASVEILICSDVALAEQDATMAKNYKKLRAVWKGSLRKRLRKDQRRWIDARDKGCRIGKKTTLTSRNQSPFIKCLITAYRKRNGVLERRLAQLDAPKGHWREPVTGMEFVQVPGGSFVMGCHANADWCDDEPKPVRTVRLDGFWLGKHEVTQRQWKQIMENNPSKFKKGDNYPVEQVSWNDVQQFISRLNSRSFAKFRLPSEAQWEYACRSGRKSVASGTYGTDTGRITRLNANYGTANCCDGDGSDGHLFTSPIGAYHPNRFGLHDMAGNVWEWVQDKKTTSGFLVIRGGGWDNIARSLRCSNRRLRFPSRTDDGLGFRLLRSR